MLYLHSMGHFNPENIISNKFLDEMDIGTTNEWIMERVGIQNRRTVLPLDYIRKTKNINPRESFSIRQYTNARAAFVSGGVGSRPSGWTKVGVTGDWVFSQDGNAVQGFAIRTTSQYLKELQKQYAGDKRRLIFIAHQANYMMLKAVCERREISNENHWYNVDQFGNTGCCGAPSTLSMHWEEIKPGDNIAMVIFGAGLTRAYMMLKAGSEQ
jgi:3-oxoacyl-[acyl-carrier-protein] synthase III